ncbi:MAG: hypothetical protein IJ544_07385 [Prevotella sp.]|nr:hypothetical protein [Prevotella sp.]
MNTDYDDIINLPHYEPKHHPRMPMEARAAQFAPFAALAGYDSAIQESGRLTDSWIDMGESANEDLNRKMELLTSKIAEHPMVSIEYFLPDAHRSAQSRGACQSKKSGGSYQTISGQVKRIIDYERIIEFTDGSKIAIDMIKDLQIG